MTLDALLAERRRRYGAFDSFADIAQSLKDVMRAQPGWAGLANDQREALEMVAHKIARILNGDPDYDDSWIDIGGYVQRIVERLQRQQGDAA